MTLFCMDIKTVYVVKRLAAHQRAAGRARRRVFATYTPWGWVEMEAIAGNTLIWPERSHG